MQYLKKLVATFELSLILFEICQPQRPYMSRPSSLTSACTQLTAYASRRRCLRITVHCPTLVHCKHQLSSMHFCILVPALIWKSNSHTPPYTHYVSHLPARLSTKPACLASSWAVRLAGAVMQPLGVSRPLCRLLFCALGCLLCPLSHGLCALLGCPLSLLGGLLALLLSLLGLGTNQVYVK